MATGVLHRIGAGFGHGYFAVEYPLKIEGGFDGHFLHELSHLGQAGGLRLDPDDTVEGMIA